MSGRFDVIHPVTGEAMIAVRPEYLKYLEDRDQWLECLESAGVDNWGGYEIALEIKNGVGE